MTKPKERTRRIEKEFLRRGEEIPIITEAICFSVRCLPGSGALGLVIPEADTSDFWCPRCRHALYWRRRKDLSRRAG